MSSSDIKTIVFGSFDPLHKGHLDFFRQAKTFGNYLVVVVARDETIRRLKGHEPRFSEGERLKAVKNESIVDKAILGDKKDYGRVLKREKPEAVCIGYDQEIPPGLKNLLKRYKIHTLAPYKSDLYKSSIISQKSIKSIKSVK